MRIETTTLPPIERAEGRSREKSPTSMATAAPASRPSRREVTASRRSFTRSHLQLTLVKGNDWTVRASDWAATASPRPSTRAMKTASTTFC